MFRLKISAALHAFGALLVAGVLVASVLAMVTVNRVHIGGQRYNEIVESKDLIADILPPPEYVIEAYLEATLVRDGLMEPSVSRAKLKALHKAYDERRAVWSQSALPDEIRTGLTVVSDGHVQRFWRSVETGLLPAAERGDQAAMNAAYVQAAAAYAAHRVVIDRIVKQATDHGDRILAESAREGRQALVAAAAIIALLLAIVVGGVAFLSRGVVRPLTRMTERMKQLAGGDNAIEIPDLNRTDEIGEMATAVLSFKQNALERIRIEHEASDLDATARRNRESSEQQRAESAREQAAVVAALANGLGRQSQGELSFRLSEPFAADYEQLRHDFNAAQDKLQDAMKVIVGNTATIRSGAAEISQASDDLARRTEQQAASVEETAAALDQITATVRSAAEGAKQASDAVGAAREDAEQGGQVVDEAVAAMGGIQRSANEIAQIIGVIDEIAFQTNLLALNAGVEAARAGDAGRGFAVVASEVRALAQRSAEAAKEIKTLISTSTSQVNLGVELVGRTGAALKRIVTQVTDVAGAVSRIAVSAQEEATGIQQVSIAVNQVDQVTQQNAAMVEQTTAASHSLAREAAELSRLVSQFRIEDEPVGGGRESTVPVAA